ncbi:MAG: hypothetical protein AAF554_00885 [Bacteroidota bacterium]
MDLIENFKATFLKRKNPTKMAADEIGPNSWGILEYDHKLYKFIKGQQGNPSKETYNSFIADVTRQLDKITIRKDHFVCQTCQ